jgi:hypothetical protein
MTLQELQSMIKEEFNSFIKEQAPMGAPPVAPMGGPPVGPGIDVAPGDVDAMEPPAGGPEGAEAQLQKIFGMLKSYFEGGEEGMEPDMDDMDAADDITPDAPEMGDEPAGDVEADEEEEPTVDEAAVSTSGRPYGATGTLQEGVKSRMQKLANIRK